MGDCWQKWPACLLHVLKTFSCPSITPVVYRSVIWDHKLLFMLFVYSLKNAAYLSRRKFWINYVSVKVKRTLCYEPTNGLKYLQPGSWKCVIAWCLLEGDLCLALFWASVISVIFDFMTFLHQRKLPKLIVHHTSTQKKMYALSECVLDQFNN